MFENWDLYLVFPVSIGFTAGIPLLMARDAWRSVHKYKKGAKFRRRHRLLLWLEGWYEPLNHDGNWNRNPKFKLSCRYKDILRCSVFKGKKIHFKSCYAPDYDGVLTPDQPRRRCIDPYWAIIYVPDKWGDFRARCFVELSFRPLPTLTMYGLYGNGLFRDDIKRTLEYHYGPWLRVRYGPTDKTL